MVRTEAVPETERRMLFSPPDGGQMRASGIFGRYLLLAPAATLLVLTLAAPLALLVVYSFWSQHGLIIDTRVTLAQYAEVISRDIYRLVFLRSLIIAAVATGCAVVLAYPVAWFIAFHTKAKFLWLLLVTVPFWTSYLLRVFAWKVILGFNGLINSGLMALHVISQPLSLLLYNAGAVTLTLTHGYAAFAVLPIYVSLEKIDPALLEAAADLGDSAWQRFVRVVLPLSIPGVITAFVLIFVPTIGDYIAPSLVGGADGQMIANLIQVEFGRADNWPLGAALAVTSIVVVGLIAYLVVRGARAAVGRIR